MRKRELPLRKVDHLSEEMPCFQPSPLIANFPGEERRTETKRKEIRELVHSGCTCSFQNTRESKGIAASRKRAKRLKSYPIKRLNETTRPVIRPPVEISNFTRCYAPN